MDQQSGQTLFVPKVNASIGARMRRGYGSAWQRLVPLWLIFNIVLLGIGFVSHTDENYLLFGFFFAYGITALSILLQVHSSVNLGSLFLWAIVIRLIFVFLIEAIPPDSTPGAIRYFSSVIWKDEGYYLGTARSLGQSFEALIGMNMSNPYERVAAYYAVWILLFGDATVWGRLVNVFVGAITSVVLYDALIQVVNEKTKRWVFWFTVLSPVLVHFSIVYLKEAILVLGISLIVSATVKLYDKGAILPQLAKIGLGVGIGVWARNTSLVPLLLPLGMTILAPKGSGRQSKPLFVSAILLATVLAGLLLAQPLQMIEFVEQFLDLQGVDTFLGAEQRLEGDINLSFPFFDVIVRLPGPLRGMGFAFLTLLSPVITSVWHLLPMVGSPDWYVFAISSHAISWWACLPFIARAIYVAIRKQDVWWTGWSICLLLWIVVAANARYGVGYDAFRYRDSLVPVIMLLAAKGLDVTFYHKGTPENKMWQYALRVYLVLVVSVILLQGIGIIGM